MSFIASAVETTHLFNTFGKNVLLFKRKFLGPDSENVY